MNFVQKNYVFILVFLIFFAGFVLRLNSISSMAFIGDQGWFYLSARDVLVNGQIPLVGITSSHTWINQGPFWTYILSIIFFLTKYNPLAPGYFTAILDALIVVIVYLISLRLFSAKTAILSSIIYAFSPILIISSKMPYHTSIIPIFTILFFFFLCKLAKGNGKYLPLSVLMLSILYNFELATQVFWGVLLIVLVLNFKIIKKQITKSLLLKTVFFFILPLVPVIIYDFDHGFPQTIKFVGWIILSPIKSLVFGSQSAHSYLDFGLFFVNFLKSLLFYPSVLVGVLLFVASIILLFKKETGEKQKYSSSNFVLIVSIIVPLLAFLFNRTPSDAYLPIFFPLITIAVGRMFFEVKPFAISLIIVLLISSINLYYTLSTNYFSQGRNNLFEDRQKVAKEIVKQSKGKPYNLIGKGEGSQYKSFTMNYEYLTWYLGNAPSEKKQKLRFVIKEKNNRIYLEHDE